MFVPNLDRHNMARWTTFLLLFGLIAVLTLTFNAQPAYAANVIYVTANVAEGTLGDADAFCSLREAVAVASNNVANTDCPAVYGNGLTNNNVIYVPNGTYNLTAATGPLLLKRAMRLRGPQVNMEAADVGTNTTRPISAATEAIIRYNSGSVTNNPLISIQSASVEIEGLTLTTGGGTYSNVYGVNISNNYADIEISNTIFTNLTYGIAVRSVSISGNSTDINGNAFINMSRTGSLRGIGVYFAGIAGSNIEIENNLFSGLQNYAIRVPSLGSATMAVNLNIQENGFYNVYSAVGLTRNDTVSISNNYVQDIVGPGTFNAVFDIFNSSGVDLNNNDVVNSSLPAVRTRGTTNSDITVNYNRLINTDILETVSAGNNYAIVIDSGSNTNGVNIDDNWWGSNDGPGAGTNDDYSDPGNHVLVPVWWLAYQVVGTPNPIGINGTDAAKSEMYADFFRTNDGTTNLNDLEGIDTLRYGTDIAVTLPFSPLPKGTLDRSVVFLIRDDKTDIVTFTSDGTSTGTQNVNFTLDDETVTYSITINGGSQVVCDYNDGLFGDISVFLTEGETIGDRCILKLSTDPGAGEYVDVTISSDNVALVGFYNSQTGGILFTSPPNGSFNVRFGSVREGASSPPVVKWDTGVVINFSAGLNGADAEGGDYYDDLVDCDITNVIGTPAGYTPGACPGLPEISLTIYDAGVVVDVFNSDLDLTGNSTDICTFPSFSRSYEVSLSGPPGLKADPAAPPITLETVTINVQSSEPSRVAVTSGATSVFGRSDWNIPQPVTITRSYTPPDVTEPNVAIWNFTTSDLSNSNTTSLYYDDGVDDNGDTVVDGVNTTLTVVNPGCPLIDREGVVTTPEQAAAPFAAAPEAGSTSEGTVGE